MGGSKGPGTGTSEVGGAGEGEFPRPRCLGDQPRRPVKRGRGPEGVSSGGGPKPDELFLARFIRWLRSYILGNHPLMEKLRARIAKVAAAEAPVLILGGTGSGKDLVAKAVHHGSARRHRDPVVAVPAGFNDTAASVLLGHDKGSFTGSTRAHEGYLKQADETSLILEDICDMSLAVQAMSLRAMEEKCFRPMGARKDVRSDFRVIATTNRPLDLEVSAGRFRQDLYFRLRAIRIVVPPLREHVSDLDLLVPHFLAKAAAGGTPRRELSPGAMALLLAYDWPGNVRELEDVLLQACVEAEGPVIVERDFEDLLKSDSHHMGIASVNPSASPVDPALARKMVLEVGGNKRKAAKRLGVAPNTLYSLLRS